MRSVIRILAAVDFSNSSGARVHGTARPVVGESADAPANACGPRGNELPNLPFFVPPTFAFEKFLIWHPN